MKPVIGKKIRIQRKLNNISQNELARKVSVTHQAVSKWENGKTLPDIEMIKTMSKIFNVNINYFINDKYSKDNQLHISTQIKFMLKKHLVLFLLIIIFIIIFCILPALVGLLSDLNN